jgi:hypothetical protein
MAVFMPDFRCNSNNPVLKPGVLFLETVSGGVLMDIEADRFLALSPLSASVWGDLATGHTLAEVVARIAIARGIAHDPAEALLWSQLRSWKRARLINIGELPFALPQSRPTSAIPSNELPLQEIQAAPLKAILIASLYIAELKYRHAIAKMGLARTLRSFQGECGRLARPPEIVIRRTLRSYNALRRMFRQGTGARDCLFRSMALAAVLRRQGVDAQLCIAIVDLPFASHAWVESGGLLLNESASLAERYKIIGRF